MHKALIAGLCSLYMVNACLPLLLDMQWLYIKSEGELYFEKVIYMKSALMWLIGVPIPLIILYNIFF